MEKPHASSRRRSVVVGVVALAVLAGIGAGVWVYFHRDPFPELPIPDLDDNRSAGKLDRVNGKVFGRASVPKDSEGMELSPEPKADDPQWGALKPGGTYFLGSLFRLAQGGQAQLLTHGGWIVAMDGDGEFILEDARRDMDGRRRSMVWTVKRGMFRAKTSQYEGSTQWLEVRTPVGRLILEEGEIGIGVKEGGHGQFWIVTGKIDVLWKDGRRKQLTEKGMDYL